MRIRKEIDDEMRTDFVCFITQVYDSKDNTANQIEKKKQNHKKQ